MANSDLHDGAGHGADERVNVTAMHAPIYHEHNEPQDGYEPVPLIWIVLALALAMWSGWYLGAFSSSFSASTYDGDAATTKTAVAHHDPGPADPTVLGRRIFNNCIPCHQQDGKGMPGQFPPLAGSEWVQGDPQILIRILLHGMQGEMVVAKNTYNGVMPAWGRLGDEQIAAVLCYIRTAWDNQAEPIKPESVAAERSRSAGRTQPWSAGELRGATP